MISVRYFYLINDVLCMVYQERLNVHLLYSFVRAFIHNSITKYYWQNFSKPLAKAFRKTSTSILLLKFVRYFVKLQNCGQFKCL